MEKIEVRGSTMNSVCSQNFKTYICQIVYYQVTRKLNTKLIQGSQHAYNYRTVNDSITCRYSLKFHVINLYVNSHLRGLKKQSIKYIYKL